METEMFYMRGGMNKFLHKMFSAVETLVVYSKDFPCTINTFIKGSESFNCLKIFFWNSLSMKFANKFNFTWNLFREKEEFLCSKRSWSKLCFLSPCAWWNMWWKFVTKFIRYSHHIICSNIRCPKFPSLLILRMYVQCCVARVFLAESNSWRLFVT